MRHSRSGRSAVTPPLLLTQSVTILPGSARDLPRRARLPTTANILHVDRALNPQTRPVVLPVTHITAQQRRLILRLRNAAALQQLSRRLHRLPPSRIEEKLLGNRNSVHGRPTSPIQPLFKMARGLLRIRCWAFDVGRSAFASSYCRGGASPADLVRQPAWGGSPSNRSWLGLVS